MPETIHDSFYSKNAPSSTFAPANKSRVDTYRYDESVEASTPSCPTTSVNFDRDLPSSQITKWRRKIAEYLQKQKKKEKATAFKRKHGGKGIVMAAEDHDAVIRTCAKGSDLNSGAENVTFKVVKRAAMQQSSLNEILYLNTDSILVADPGPIWRLVGQPCRKRVRRRVGADGDLAIPAPGPAAGPDGQWMFIHPNLIKHGSFLHAWIRLPSMLSILLDRGVRAGPVKTLGQKLHDMVERERNAGLLIRKLPQRFQFESFELSAKSPVLMSTVGRLVRSFPGAAIAVDQTKVSTPGFRDVLTETLFALESEGIDESISKFPGHAPRDGIPVLKLPGILRGLGSPVAISRIHKRTKDEGIFGSGPKPFRRSPRWLLLKVSLQTTLADQKRYEIFMIYFTATALERAVTADVSSDKIHVMLAKIARRIMKLGFFIKEDAPWAPLLEPAAKAAVFELDIPSFIRSWRSISYQILADVLNPLPYEGLKDYVKQNVDRLEFVLKTRPLAQTAGRAVVVFEATEEIACLENRSKLAMQDSLS
ncbi:hypothetical protein MBM_05371 [Drepanopeziza brunnea f. sp. 'multigermtubi' MB_m1]|uniref:DUF6606 domain-containing protein n=1 Tax=Marssonina brunnea f. sp. multigermtubi (strain MB_m1) TaxID=1072389 RepID=K1WWK8_MARBU|nr:uncharacterized protein MBM_05371 [Drepanopeziza brunnea f. sp. 'multigermtubi' MB_m1]EKD16902.1 hypothetical protein MBM_05371 [Drepanopeziza brunnea f. sp. 'multigermtubi' MB_m1]